MQPVPGGWLVRNLQPPEQAAVRRLEPERVSEELTQRGVRRKRFDLRITRKRIRSGLEHAVSTPLTAIDRPPADRTRTDGPLVRRLSGHHQRR